MEVEAPIHEYDYEGEPVDGDPLPVCEPAESRARYWRDRYFYNRPRTISGGTVENFSKADELGKLADLRDRGLISEKDFERQKKGLLDQPWDWRRPRSLIGMGVALVVAIALVGTLVIAGGENSPTKSSGKVTFADASATTGQVQAAVSYAESFVGHDHLDGLCLTFVNDAWASTGMPIGSSSDPVTYWSDNPKGWTEHASLHAYNNAPEGALLFWGANQWNADGHVGIAVDNGGDVVSTSAYPYYHGVNGSPDVLEFNVSQRSPVTYNYLGWIMPGGAVPTAPPATPTPNPTPTPTTQAAPTVVGSAPQPIGTGSVGGTGPVAGATQTQGGGAVSTPSPNPAPAGSTSPAGTGTSGGSAAGSGPSPTSTVAQSSPPPTASPAPQPSTYTEYAGGVAHTWTDYSDAGGTEGPSLPASTPIQIACKVVGFRVADGNTWWYRIAQSPWSNSYYVSADAFYNDGATSGSLHGTPFVDPSVPNC